MRPELVIAGLLFVLGRVSQAQSVQGTAVEQGSSRSVLSGVVVLLDEPGNEVARTQLVQGRFALTAPAPGRYRVRFDAVGFRTSYTPPFDLAAGATLAITIQVRAQTPVPLDTVEIAGELVPARLADFYRRRAAGFGSFLTREEWENSAPIRVTDAMRRMSGFTIVPNPRYLTGGDQRPFLIISNRMGQVLGQQCPPLVYVDGSYAGNTANYDLDNLLAIEHLAGIELYNGAGAMPAEFNRSGANCGVISAWTLAESATTAPAASHLDLGWQLGARVTADGMENGRVGARAVVALKGVIEFHPAMNVIFGSSAGETRVAGWQVLAALRVRPLGRRFPWYLGTGVTAISLDESFVGDVRTVKDSNHHVVLTGLTLPLGFLRPFVEFQVLGPLAPRRSQVHLFTGLGLRVY